MKVCEECGVVDIEPKIVIKDDEEYELCPECDAEFSIREVDEAEWLKQMEDDEADKINDWIRDHEDS